MTTTTLTAESIVELTPSEAFRMFGAPSAGTWLFDARCQSVKVGAAVSLRLPMRQGPRSQHVDLLGRLSIVRPHSLVVIEHSQPWRGRIKLLFEPAGPTRTRLRVRADVDSSGIDWLVRQSGAVLPVPATSRNAVRIGVVTSKTGPAAIYAMATEYLAELAVDEVNESGGIDGRRLELLIADDATDAAQAAREARRLIRSGCRAIFACTTSQSFAAIRKVAGQGQVLLVHAVMNERGRGDPASVLRLGEDPWRQLEALAGRVVHATGGRRWFLVGESYSWSYGAHLAARRAVPSAKGRVIGEAYSPLGNTDFAHIIDLIRRSQAEVVLSSLIGADEVAFQQQCAAAGLRGSMESVSLVMDESTCEHIGPAADGIWTALGYFQDVPTAGNADLLGRYRGAIGRWSPPLSTLSVTVYEAILQYARAVQRHVDDDPRGQIQVLREHNPRAADTAIGSRNLLRPQLYLARVRSGGPRVFDQAG